MVQKKELLYVELSPRPTQRVRRVNEERAKKEKRRKVLNIIAGVGVAAVLVAAFYIFACALFTYGANW